MTPIDVSRPSGYICTIPIKIRHAWTFVHDRLRRVVKRRLLSQYMPRKTRQRRTSARYVQKWCFQRQMTTSWARGARLEIELVHFRGWRMATTHSYSVRNACKSTRLPPKIIFTEFQHLAIRGCRYIKLGCRRDVLLLYGYAAYCTALYVGRTRVAP